MNAVVDLAMTQHKPHELANLTLDELRSAVERGKVENAEARAALRRQVAESREALKRADELMRRP